MSGYSFNKDKKMEIQCISTKCGLFKDLKIGQWYDAFEYDDVTWGIQYGKGFWDFNAYNKILFRTISDRRDKRLEKIGII